MQEAIQEWNSLHAERDGVMLLPVVWERDATPEMGERPQAIINRQLVDVADILIGIFWTRLGTATSESQSGTAEEIERFIEADKPVLLYFDSQPVAPDVVDPEQLAALTAYREDLEARGLIDRFVSAEELRLKVTAGVTRTIRARFMETDNSEAEPEPQEPAMPPVPGAVLIARIDREREMSGFSSTGRPQYRTSSRLAIENRGTVAAEVLSFDFEAPGSADDERLPQVLAAEDQVINRLPPGGVLEYPLAMFMGMVPQWDIIFRWHEGSIEYEERQTLVA